MMQTETKYKQEIALIKAQTHIEQKRFHSIHTQTSSEKSISPETEIHENHSSSHSAEEPNEESLSIIHQFQTQIENLGENMKKYEEKIEKERKKNQQYSSVIERLHSVVKQQKRKIVLLKKQINAKNEYSYSQTNQNDTEITEVSINQKEEIEGLKKTLNIYEKILNEQKSDIDKVLNDRNNLIEVIQKQSQYIFKSDSFIDKLESKQKEQIIKIENKPINKSFCKADNDMENIDWSLENFPDDVVQIMKPVAENNCIPINTRTHHVMSIISRYTNNVESSYDNKLSKFKEENQETQKKLSDFVSGILSSLGEKNDLPENEIVDKVSQVSHDNLLLKQKVNELDLSLKVASSKKIDINETPTVKNLNQTIKELKAQNKRRAIEIKECKSAFIECQKKASDEKELLISSNERMKHEIGELQEQYNILHEQYDALVEKIDKIKVVQEEENNEHQKEIENLHEMNAANFDYIIQKSKEDLQRKDEEIAKIQSLLEKTQQKIYHMEESSRMTLEDLDDQTRQKLEKYKAQMEQKMEKAIQEKETEMEHIKEQYEDQINVLRSNISDEETHKKQILEAGEKIKEAEKMISELENKVIKLTYQIQQDNLKFKSDIERLERENKIKDVQQKAKLMSMETNYSIKTDEITQKLLNEKKEFMCFIVQQFNSFYDSTAELNEESVKMAIRGIKRELECQQKREEAIRMLVSAKKGQTTEDALTNMIISLHPKLGEKNHDKPRVM
ncbi:hypothetical protein TRFO_16250 [Tritrichomonas foetus]|uniref:Uncharacterized protein n=1 Tax=Tritrichomonas foetus TaxID=1144522 RepID=A0A1J4KQD6_9EUKA|nr:hypothetical protein TRFO_16250 [Tritrichomonas foetus]|eukprot:OHT13503.1 hypothetical protein TRFO_16250 [Tritrichomonas foetus]